MFDILSFSESELMQTNSPDGPNGGVVVDEATYPQNASIALEDEAQLFDIATKVHEEWMRVEGFLACVDCHGCRWVEVGLR